MKSVYGLMRAIVLEKEGFFITFALMVELWVIYINFVVLTIEHSKEGDKVQEVLNTRPIK